MQYEFPKIINKYGGDILYKKFESLLETRGKTAYQVSKATDIPASTFSDWKSGRSTPKIDKIKKIADYFGVSIEYFYDGKVN